MHICLQNTNQSHNKNLKKSNKKELKKDIFYGKTNGKLIKKDN